MDTQGIKHPEPKINLHAYNLRNFEAAFAK